MRAHGNKICVVLLGVLLCAGAQAAEIDRAKAAAVMAAYLRHIAALTSWPESAAAGAREPLLIGAIGRDPNGVMDPFRQRMQSEEGLVAQGRPIQLVELNPAADEEGATDQLVSCALVFLSEGTDEEWRHLRPLVGSLPIVTVSEMEGFADQGGMIEYFVDRQSGKVRMKINLQAMRAAGVSFSARLLVLESVIVMDAPEEA